MHTYIFIHIQYIYLYTEIKKPRKREEIIKEERKKKTNSGNDCWEVEGMGGQASFPEKPMPPMTGVGSPT